MAPSRPFLACTLFSGLLLADGPPTELAASAQTVDGVDSTMELFFSGDLLSQIFPSLAQAEFDCSIQ
jgi:hypothetical protein